MSSNSSNAAGEHELEVPNLGFRVVFPAAPTRNVQQLTGEIRLVQITLHTAVFRDADFMAGVAVYPPELLTETSALLDSGERAALSQAGSPVNISSEDLSIPIPEIRCRRVTYEEAQHAKRRMSVELRLCVHRNRLYTLGVFDPTGGALASFTREFFSSFELLSIEGRPRTQSAVFRAVSASLDLDCVPKTLSPLLGLHRLDHRAGYLLGQVDGAKTYGEIIGASGVSQSEGIRFFTDLLQMGLIANSWRRSNE